MGSCSYSSYKGVHSDKNTKTRNGIVLISKHKLRDQPSTSEFIRRSSSCQSITSHHSRSSGSGSVRQVNYGNAQVKPMKFGSRRSDSEGMGLSQKEISDEDARFIYINDPEKMNEKYDFSSNSIQTSKYSIITFFPRNLYEQFHRVAYIYFLIIAVLNQLPQLVVFGQATSILPLAFVLLVSAIKDGYEDFRRHQLIEV